MPKVELKKGKSDKSADVVVGIHSTDDYMAVKGTEKGTFNGKVKVLHKIAAQKLIDKKFAVEDKSAFTVTSSKNRSSVDLEETK